jgi:Fibronectin type III-like domain
VPGEERTVLLELTALDFAFYDVDSRQWKVEGGAYDVLGGFSAAEILGRVTCTINGRTVSASHDASPV